MQLSPHFSLAEATRSATADAHELHNNPNDEQLANMLHTAFQMENVRRILGDNPIHVNSWFRSAEVNAAVGGVPNSAHAKGFAVDFTCDGYGDPLQVCRAIVATALPFDQLIYEYDTWVHIAFCNCPRPRRQVLTKRTGKNYMVGLPA